MPTPTGPTEPTEGDPSFESEPNADIIAAHPLTSEGFPRTFFGATDTPDQRLAKLGDFFDGIGGDSLTKVLVANATDHVRGLTAEEPSEFGGLIEGDAFTKIYEDIQPDGLYSAIDVVLVGVEDATFTALGAEAEHDDRIQISNPAA